MRFNIDKIRIEFAPKDILNDTNLFNQAKARSEEFRKQRPSYQDFTSGDHPRLTQEEAILLQKKLETRKRDFAASQTRDMEKIKELSDIFETLMVDQIENNAWLGDLWNVYLASEHDDIFNGIDAVMVETEPNDDSSELAHLGLGIDVTFSSDVLVIKSKLDKIVHMIERNILPKIEYFFDENGKPLEKPITVPKIILSASYPSVDKIIRIWSSNDTEKNKKLAQSKIKFIFLLEALFQLRYFHDLAIEKDRQEIAYVYGYMYNKLIPVYKENIADLEASLTEIMDDTAFDFIKNYTGN